MPELKPPSKKYFAKAMRKIKRENAKKDCWKCEYLIGVYYDGITFHCKKLGDNSMWWFEGDNCIKFKHK